MLMDIIKERHSIRKYTDKQIFDRSHLAGSFVSKEQPKSKPRKPGRIKIVE